MTNAAAVSELLKPYDAWLMRCYPVSNGVNSVSNDGPECSAPMGPDQIQNRLFV
jgi:putative SOS response-associated peptidase YedK